MEFPNRAKRSLDLLIAYLKSIFNWVNLRWLLAELLHHTILINGAIISGTGSFKAIPLLFGILGLPTFLTTPFCWLAASTAFVCFYVQFDDSMSKTAYYFIDSCKSFINKYLLRKRDSAPPPSETPFGQLQQILNDKQTELGSLKQSNEALCSKLISSNSQEGQLKKYQDLLTTEAYEEYNKLLNDLKERIKLVTPVATDTQSNSPATVKQKLLNILFQIFKFSVKFFAIGLVLLGSAVAIGMGIITTQAFVAYMGIAVIGKLIIAAIVLASTLKQLCQMTLTVLKQYQVYCVLFKVGPSETQLLQKDIMRVTQEIAAQRQIEQQLKQIESDITEKEPVVKRYNDCSGRLLTLFATNPRVRTLTSRDFVELIESGLDARATARPPTPSYHSPAVADCSSRASTPPPALIPAITPSSSRSSSPCR